MHDNVQPKVSVAIATYNHEKYIAQAIESVLMQVTDFPVEIVIGEDCSTDGTCAIVRRYAANHPDKIRLLLQEKNRGMDVNGRATLAACRGKYTALLEGDDYWTDPHKLQRQVEFMEKNAECTLCFQNVLFQRESNWGGDLKIRSGELYDVSWQSRATFADFVGGFCPPTPGCMLLNDPNLLRPLLSEQWYCYSGTLFYCLTRGGGVGLHMPGTMAVYRLHSGGVWSPFSAEKKRVEMIKKLEVESSYFDDAQTARLFDARLYKEYLLLAVEQIARGKITAALGSYKRGIRFLRHWPSKAQWLLIVSVHSRIVLWPFRRAKRIVSKLVQAENHGR